MDHSEAVRRQKKTRRYMLLILAVLFVIGTVQALSGRSGTITAQVDSTTLGVLGTTEQPVFIRLSEIRKVELADALEYGALLDGEETGNTLTGTCENDEFGVYTLCVYTDKAPYIVVHYGQDETLVFNQKTRKLTEKIYGELTR